MEVSRGGPGADAPEYMSKSTPTLRTSTPTTPQITQAYEHLPLPRHQQPTPENALIFIGGLGDGPNSIPYVRTLALHLSTLPHLSYSVFETRLHSAHTGYGYSSLDEDTYELAELVRHLRTRLGKKKVVLMGHSTGGDDDYFSSDLPDEKLENTWGKLKEPVLIMPSEKDEWVSPRLDVLDLVEKWVSFCKPGIASELSGLIPGANHRVDNEDGQSWLADCVARFLADIEKR
ncbi:hypothetical protein N0V88_001958 [Collariella sp. IMI 366227]|nr:hypothetical protein N0V88_001958 [Collariella sp. IMI 366227]